VPSACASRNGSSKENQNERQGPEEEPLSLFLASLAPCFANPALVIHYAPAENLEKIDVALIDSARQEIDFAAYVLTDWPVIQDKIEHA
jgi:hypothetical protein